MELAIRYRQQRTRRDLETVRALMVAQPVGERRARTLGLRRVERIQGTSHSRAAGLLPILVGVQVAKRLPVRIHPHIAEAPTRQEA